MKITLPTTLIFGAESTFDGPAEAKAHGNCLPLDLSNPSPFTDAEVFAVVENQSISTRVLVLLHLCSPPAIVSAVALAVVDSVKRVLWGWAHPHVGNEVLEFNPTLANRDSATAVSRKCLVSRIRAAVNHACPSPMLGSPISTSRRSVSGPASFNSVNVQASAREAISAFKTCGSNYAFQSAIASAKPLDMLTSVWVFAMTSKPDHGKPSKFLASEVLEKLVSWKWNWNRFVSGVHNLSMDFVSAASGLQSHVARLFSHNISCQSMGVSA